MTPIEILQLAKTNIAADPLFDLNDFCHCVAPHVCRAAGDTEFNDNEEVIVNGQPMHVAARAFQLLGTPRIPLLFSCSHGGCGTERQEAERRLDLAIDWFVKNAPTPAPQPIEVVEQELTYA